MVPGDGGVAVGDSGGTGHDPSMGMPFRDLKFSLERDIVERVRQLAQSATNGWHKTAFLQLPPAHEASRMSRFSELTPKAELLPGWNDHLVELLGSYAKVVDFSALQSLFGRINLTPERCDGFGEEVGTGDTGVGRVSLNWTCEVLTNSKEL